MFSPSSLRLVFSFAFAFAIFLLLKPVFINKWLAFC